MIEDYYAASATFSDDMLYRYLLTRTWEKKGSVVTFLMLNPSTADAEKFDPTVKRCFDFAHAWGCGQMIVCNIFAFRSTNPRNLYMVDDPVGKDNDTAIKWAAGFSDMVIAAWGVHGTYLERDKKVISLITESPLEQPLYCLGITKDGHPKHPLYLKSDLKPIIFKEARNEEKTT